MTTKAQLRKAALALPETGEDTHFGMLAYSVRGKGFASLTDDGWVQLQLPGRTVPRNDSLPRWSPLSMRIRRRATFQPPSADRRCKPYMAKV